VVVPLSAMRVNPSMTPLYDDKVMEGLPKQRTLPGFSCV